MHAIVAMPVLAYMRPAIALLHAINRCVCMATPQVRHTCLSTICKILFVPPPSVLEPDLRELPISNFIAGLLLGKDMTSAAYAMQACVTPDPSGCPCR